MATKRPPPCFGASVCASGRGVLLCRVEFCYKTLCQPDISTHISISAALSVSSHTDRASRNDTDANAPWGHSGNLKKGTSPEGKGR
eukprot:scaffold2415_cov111-Isochrysis_galbana.AAC.5